MTPEQLMQKLNKKFQGLGIFDIVDTEVHSYKDVVEKARSHIKWYRMHTEEMAQFMEKELKNTMVVEGKEEVLYE